MIHIEIVRPRIEETEQINAFFNNVLYDTFKKNNLLDLVETYNEEINDKRRCLNQDFESAGEDRYFLIAKDKGAIIGSIEYGLSNELINSCTNGALKELVEIGTVFVHPDYQQKGIGNILLNSIFKKLDKRGINEFCFDSGYKSAQKIWVKKFGNPQYFFKDYWGEGNNHMIWRLKVKDVIDYN